jgi:hypothetical protein
MLHEPGRSTSSLLSSIGPGDHRQVPTTSEAPAADSCGARRRPPQPRWPRCASPARRCVSLAAATRHGRRKLSSQTGFAAPHTDAVQILAASCDDEMVATFLRGELSSERFGGDIRSCLVSRELPERLLTDADLSDAGANAARRAVLAATRGYGENRELFIDFPAEVTWIKAILSASEIASVRYMDYSYWHEISGGSRLPADAAARIKAGMQAWDVPNGRFVTAARALTSGAQFPPLILVGENREELVCLEGHLRLTAHALAGFPMAVECLVGTAPTMGRWTQ